MQRYIAFAWDHRVDERQARVEALETRLKSISPEFRCALSTDGLRVYLAEDGAPIHQTYILIGNRGIVIGRLFRLGSDTTFVSPQKVLGDRESRSITDSAGRHLVEKYWGRYVAMISGSHGTTVRVLRDPTGAMPCQWVNVAGVAVLCSDLADCHDLALVDCSINWDHVARFLWFHRLVTGETGLTEVRHVQAGECITLREGRVVSTYYWTPDKVLDQGLVDDRAEAVQRLSACIQTCVTSWSSCYSSILHRLSGGLDSAIVLACMAGDACPGSVIAQNLYTQGSEGDERRFAHAAARRAGIALFETQLVPSDRPFEEILDSTLVATPASTQLKIENTMALDKLVRQYDINAVFSGQGGDHLFQRTATCLIAAEYASRRGFRPDLVPIVLDTARFTKGSVWSVIAAVATFGVFRRHYDPYVQRFKPPPFLNAATRDALDIRWVRHPWVDSAMHLPSAKILQIADIIDSQNFHNASYSNVDAIHPLISQPIIELCLQIPSYILTYGGIDRALVREAFREQLPAEIVHRTSKGGTTRYVYNYFAQNLSNIREYLLDGVLAGHGILDRSEAADSLTEARLIREPTLLFPILNSLRAEAWLRSWKRANRPAVP